MAATRTRLNGSTLSLEVDGKEYNTDVSEWELSEEEKDGGTVTFADAANGTTGQLKLSVTAIQSLDVDSLHQVVMDNPGKRNVAFKLAPAGADKASPYFEGKLDFPKMRPNMGLAAGDNDATTEMEFNVTEWAKKPGTSRTA